MLEIFYLEDMYTHEKHMILELGGWMINSVWRTIM